jgi:transcriptional regulator with XRE-family HTH domain
MLVPSRNKGQAQVLLAKLKKDYLMSQREVARYCGVNFCVVNKWATGKYVASDANLDKMREALVLLAGRNVRYPKQAMDILEGRE